MSTVKEIIYPKKEDISSSPEKKKSKA